MKTADPKDKPQESKPASPFGNPPEEENEIPDFDLDDLEAMEEEGMDEEDE